VRLVEPDRLVLVVAVEHDHLLDHRYRRRLARLAGRDAHQVVLPGRRLPEMHAPILSRTTG
jgi:hypothetical protein